MKKFLLSIFAVLFAFAGVQAETLTLTAGTDFTATSGEFLDGSLEMTTAKNSSSSNPAYNANNKELRLYYNSGGNGGSVTFTTDGTIKITGVKVTASTTPAVKYSVNGGNMVSAGSWTGGAITISGIEATESIEIQNANTTNTQLRIKSFVITYETVGVSVSKPEFTPADGTRFDESLEVTIGVENGLRSFYSTDGGANYKEGNSVVIAETTTILAYAMDGAGNKSAEVSATYTKNVPGQTIDVLTCAMTGATTNSYVDWDGKTSISNAVYAGNSANNNGAIQLRATNPSAIVTTQSGGKVKKITIDWNSNTAATRELWVYGKNTAYTNPTELYNASTDGDKLAEIAYGTTEFIIEGDYEYIGLRSGSGAMYLNSIEITWVVEEEEPVAETWSSFYADFPVAIPEGIEAYIVTAANAGYVTLTQIYNAVPASTGVILKGGSIEATYDNYYSGEVTEVTGNLLQGTMTNTYISEEAYVLGKVDGVIGLYKAKMTDGQWLNNANKAYLPASVASGAASYSFRFPGTTGIDEVTTESGNVKGIYDLTGRRVEAITAPGIYVVNGKKVLVK